MRTEITTKIKAIELDENVKTLLACETGSRAWGFPSPDSDYDVRLIYLKPMDSHLSIRQEKDTLEAMDGDLDITGWEFKKVCSLLWKSNIPLLERLQSPIIYTQNKQWLVEMRLLSTSYFSPIASMHHYHSMSKKYVSSCLSEKTRVKLKKYFYAIRTTIAGIWIREIGTMPPMVLKDMFDLVDDDVRMTICELINLKSMKTEDYWHTRIEPLDEFLIKQMNLNDRVSKQLRGAEGSIDVLNDFYRETVKAHA